MSPGLSQRVRQLLSDPENSLYLSLASACEPSPPTTAIPSIEC